MVILACFFALAVATSDHIQTDFTRKFIHKLRSRRCSANVSLYPPIGMMIEEAHDDTNDEARSYYNKFSLRFVRSANPSKLQMALEYKNPQLNVIGEQVNVKWTNILFTAKLSVQEKNSGCYPHESTLLGFVELVKTDVAWYKYDKNGIKFREENLACKKDLQYVMTKPSPQSRYIFADDSPESVVKILPKNYAYLAPLKYESSENIVIDFEKYPNTLEYERLVEKKIFLVQITTQNVIKQVLAGVDVMMYLNFRTYNFTDVPHISLSKNHSLIQRITNPEKYVTVIDSARKHHRNRELSYQEAFEDSQIVTLDPLPKNIHVYTN